MVRKGEEMRYMKLLKKAIRNPEGADFRTLRYEFARNRQMSTDFGMYSLWNEAREHMRLNRLAEAKRSLLALLDRDYTDIDAHRLMAVVCKLTGEENDARFHSLFSSGLLDSVIQSGTGHDYNSAFRVIKVREEYLVLEAFGFNRKSQALVQHGDSMFDILTCALGDDAPEIEIYFNIDLVYSCASHHVQPVKEVSAKKRHDFWLTFQFWFYLAVIVLYLLFGR